VAQLGQPIDHRQRDQFLIEVGAEREAGGQASEVGIGSVPGCAQGAETLF